MRSKTIVLLIGLLLLMAVLALSACSGQSSAQTTDVQTADVTETVALSPITLVQEPVSGSFTILTDLSADVELPQAASVMVYRVKRPVVDAGAVRAMADAVGIGTGEAGEADDYLFVKASAGTLSIDKVSGAIFYDTPELEGTGQPLKDVRENSDYRTEAEKFLKKTGLWREGALYVGVSKEEMVATDEDGKEGTHPLSVEVLLAPAGLGGLKWVGAGPKISVFFGEGARVTGAAVYWPEVEPYKEYPTISGQQALENIKAGKGSIVLATPNEKKGVVRQVELAYWCDPVGYPQQFVAPYYKMQGVTADGSAFTAYTRAIPAELVEETAAPSPRNPVAPMTREDQ